MKRDTLEKWILLEQSGELDDRRRAALEHALKSDPDARAYRNALRGITEAARTEPDAATPDAAVTARILREARKHRDRSGPGVLVRFPVWGPRLAYAAAGLVLAVGGWLVLHKPPSGDIVQDVPHEPAENAEILAWDDGFESDLALISSIMAYTEEEWNLPAESDPDLDDLARELIELEDTNI